MQRSGFVSLYVACTPSTYHIKSLFSLASCIAQKRKHRKLQKTPAHGVTNVSEFLPRRAWRTVGIWSAAGRSAVTGLARQQPRCLTASLPHSPMRPCCHACARYVEPVAAPCTPTRAPRCRAAPAPPVASFNPPLPPRSSRPRRAPIEPCTARGQRDHERQNIISLLEEE